MPASEQLYWIYLAGALAVGVILAALLAALFIYQRHNLKLHQTYAKKLLDDVAKMVEKQKKERGISKLPAVSMP